MTKLYHVALSELESSIREDGLDPERRMIALFRDPPEVPDGFDVWEVEADVDPAAGETILSPVAIGPERLELMGRAPEFGM